MALFDSALFDSAIFTTDAGGGGGPGMFDSSIFDSSIFDVAGGPAPPSYSQYLQRGGVDGGFRPLAGGMEA